MIDIENYVIDRISTGLAVSHPDAEVLGEFVDRPERFPCVCAEQNDRETYTRSRDGSLYPHHETVFFSVTVFSAALGEKKAEAKAIMEDVVQIMESMKFTLTMCSPTPNVDRTVYRLTARFRAVHGNAKTVGDNEVVQMYRE